MFGRTTNSLIGNLRWARQGIFSFSYAPLEFITVAGLLTVVASAVASIAIIVIRIVSPHRTPSGITTVILIVLFIGGIQLTAISIIGSYLAHIYDEVKKRPAFIVESMLNAPAPQEAMPATDMPTAPSLPTSQDRSPPP